jgi:hypothetical protein
VGKEEQGTPPSSLSRDGKGTTEIYCQRGEKRIKVENFRERGQVAAGFPMLAQISSIRKEFRGNLSFVRITGRLDPGSDKRQPAFGGRGMRWPC